MNAKREIAGPLRFLKALFAEWSKDNVPRQSAAIAYYTVFSLPSFLLVVITVAALVLGQSTVEEGVFGQIGSSLGPSTAETLRSTVANIQTIKASALMTAVGIGALLLGALGVFRELQTSLNQILGVDPPRRRGGILGTIRSYLLSFSLLLTTAFLLLVSMTLSGIVAAVGRVATRSVDLPIPLIGIAEFALSAVVILVLFTLLYRFLPDRRFPWKSLLAGAAASTALFLAGKAVIGTYLARAATVTQYGIAASILVLLLWIYYSSMIFLTGAEVIDQCERQGLFRSGKRKVVA